MPGYRERAVDYLLGTFPADKLSQLVDKPENQRVIEQQRRQRVLAAVIREITATYATHAFLQLPENVGPLAGTLTSDIMLDAVMLEYSEQINRTVYVPMWYKICTLYNHISLINLELSNRGYEHDGTYAWRMYYDIMDSEQQSNMLSVLLTLARPLLQAISLSNVLAPHVVMLSTLLSYALIPFYMKLGKFNYSQTMKSQSLLETAAQFAFLGSPRTAQRVKNIQEQMAKIVRRNRLLQVGLQRADDLVFLLVSLLTRSGTLGLYNAVKQLYSVPSSFQYMTQSRMKQKESVGRLDTTYDIMSGNPFFLTESSWNDYRQKRLDALGKPQTQMTGAGIELSNFCARIPQTEEDRYTSALSFHAKPGDVIQVQGESGSGKSVTTGMGIAGIVATQGEFVLSDADGSAYWLESFSKKQIMERIVYVQSTEGTDGIRVCDMFNTAVMEQFCAENEIDPALLSNDELHIFTMPDKLLQIEIELHQLAQEKKNSSTGKRKSTPSHLLGKVPVLPSEMVPFMIAFRAYRRNHVDNYLHNKAANFATISSDDEIGKHSRGMRARLMWELASQKSKHNSGGKADQTRVLILDEPFENLDSSNVNEYLQILHSLVCEPDPPIIILISHSNKAKITKTFKEHLKRVSFVPTIDNPSGKRRH